MNICQEPSPFSTRSLVKFGGKHNSEMIGVNEGELGQLDLTSLPDGNKIKKINQLITHLSIDTKHRKVAVSYIHHLIHLMA